MIDVTCISDLHGFLPSNLPGGDLLIVAGDHTARDREDEYFKFFDWLSSQLYDQKIIIAGNHDGLLEREEYKGPVGQEFIYLCDSGCEYKGLKIWGSPYTKRFYGQNPACMAFAVDLEAQLGDHWAMIPTDIDILITHTPPYDILDRNYHNSRCGSQSLSDWVMASRPNLQLHVFGHIHGSSGVETIAHRTFCNASYVDEDYMPVNGYKRFLIDPNDKKSDCVTMSNQNTL